MKLLTPEEYGYVTKNNVCLFQKGPLSQWWGGFKGQNSKFSAGFDHPCHFQHDVREGLFSCGIDKNFADSYIEFNCMEQYMMFCKAVLFGDKESAEKILNSFSPVVQKDLGRKVKNYNQAIWGEVRFDAVYIGNRLKFGQNPELRDFLAQFPKPILFAEASPWDKIWGIGIGPEEPRALDITKWDGENLLGEVIRKVRQEL